MPAAAPFRPHLSLGVVLAGLLLMAPAGRCQGKPAPGSSTTPTLGEPLRASDARQMGLAEHLRSSGALFYGAWWCPACFRQKHLFGKEAGNRLPYVECDKTDSGRERCRTSGIRAYPTWILGERRLEGIQTIEQLSEWSGYGERPSP
jgi:hypothetical protein